LIAGYCSRTRTLSALPRASIKVSRTKHGPPGLKNNERRPAAAREEQANRYRAALDVACCTVLWYMCTGYRTARPAVLDQPHDRTMNAHGGKRLGAGRPTGVASRANEQVRQEAAATGELPLAYMLRIMRDPSQPVGRRDEMAKAAAPFCHSRLSSVEHSGEIARPTVIRAPAFSATPAEWQAEYVPGAKEKH
jgi:hypothetical protein